VIPGLGERFKEARLKTAVKLNATVSQGRMAQLVTQELAKLKSPKTISQPQWSDYEAEKAEPSTIVYRAVSRVSGLPEAYLAFGANAEAVANPSTDRKLTEEELDRADAAAAASRSSKRAKNTANARTPGRRPGRGPRAK